MFVCIYAQLYVKCSVCAEQRCYVLIAFSDTDDDDEDFGFSNKRRTSSKVKEADLLSSAPNAVSSTATSNYNSSGNCTSGYGRRYAYPSYAFIFLICLNDCLGTGFRFNIHPDSQDLTESQKIERRYSFFAPTVGCTIRNT